MTRVLELPMPDGASTAEKRAIRQFVEYDTILIDVAVLERFSLPVRAALLLLRDLRAQGWVVHWSGNTLVVEPAEKDLDVEKEKLRVQLQERLKRDEQLSVASVRRFVEAMESPREYQGRFASIFSLMRDGEELAEAVQAALASNTALSAVVDPYLQFVDAEVRCEFTGLRLMDVWRYFRHTWSNQYVSTPGRSMPILVRDRAAANHPVIGIASIGSAIVQLSERDKFIGWNSEDVLARIEERPSAADARWLLGRLEAWRSELYVADLVADGLYRDDWWDDAPEPAIEALRAESIARRRRHQRLGRKADFTYSRSRTDESWELRARSDLYRSKRSALLAELLRCRHVLTPSLQSGTAKSLADLLNSSDARRAVRWISRRAKSETVGTEIADITVCGAIAPYSHLLGGKLVSSLLASPSIVRGYDVRYGRQPSEIASAMAGRPIVRPSKLVFLGTTSLYGSGASQYNRINIPAEVLNGANSIRFTALGRSRSYGTSHLSQDTVQALTTLAERSQDGARVKSIFGEGASPKLRKLREGLDLLGWPSDELLQHRRERIVYGVPLTSDPAMYLLRRSPRPQYLFDVEMPDDTARISEWWRERWLRPRARRADVLAAVRTHSTRRPVRHGARVVLPPTPEGAPQLPEEGSADL